MMRKGFLLGAIVLAMLVPRGASAADKTDVIILNNGDHITGEIKSLEHGQLTLKTDAVGTVYIEWRKIARIQTKQLLEIQQADGRRIYGRIPTMAPTGKVALELQSASGKPLGTKEIATVDAVQMVPLAEGNFFDRLDGHISAGVNTASANSSRQYTLSADATLRDELRAWQVAYDGAHDQSSGNPSSDRSTFTLAQRRYLGPIWFWAAGVGLVKNDELGLNLRSQYGLGFGRFFLRDQSQELAALVGVYRNHESFKDGTRQNSYEGLLQGNYTFFRTSDPEVDLSVGLNLYPSLTVSGRIRSEANVTSRYEIIKDLYFQLSYIASWDNKPQSEGAQRRDWSIVSSLGYKF